MAKKQLVKSMLQDVYSSKLDTIKMVKQYFHEDYSQIVDGNKMTLKEFLEHIERQKQSMSEIQFNFIKMIEEKDWLCSLHIANALDSFGDIIQVEIQALFQFEKDKIIYCHGLTHLIEGNAKAADLSK